MACSYCSYCVSVFVCKSQVLSVRPYVERLVQMMIEHGLHDDYTKEMVEWWMVEKDLIHKLEYVCLINQSEVNQSVCRITGDRAALCRALFERRNGQIHAHLQSRSSAHHT